jgi:hypothetical protein
VFKNLPRVQESSTGGLSANEVRCFNGCHDQRLRLPQINIQTSVFGGQDGRYEEHTAPPCGLDRNSTDLYITGCERNVRRSQCLISVFKIKSAEMAPATIGDTLLHASLRRHKEKYLSKKTIFRTCPHRHADIQQPRYYLRSQSFRLDHQTTWTLFNPMFVPRILKNVWISVQLRRAPPANAHYTDFGHRPREGSYKKNEAW